MSDQPDDAERLAQIRGLVAHVYDPETGTVKYRDQVDRTFFEDLTELLGEQPRPTAHAIARRDRSKHLRAIEGEMGLVTEGLIDAKVQRRAAGQVGTNVIREGHTIAQFLNYNDAHFFTHAQRYLGEVISTIRNIEDELQEARTQRRSFAVLTNLLLKAKDAGIATREGINLIKAAHSEAQHPTPNKPWDW